MPSIIPPPFSSIYLLSYYYSSSSAASFFFSFFFSAFSFLNIIIIIFLSPFLLLFSHVSSWFPCPSLSSPNSHFCVPHYASSSSMLFSCSFLIPPSHLFRISRNQAEPAGMKNFKHSRHIREGILNPVTLEAEWAGMEIIYIFLDMRFGGVLNYVRTHSWANWDVLTEFEPQPQQLKCIRGAFRLIRGAFGTFWQDLKWLAVSILLRRWSECFECCWNAVKARKNMCSSNAVW